MENMMDVVEIVGMLMEQQARVDEIAKEYFQKAEIARSGGSLYLGKIYTGLYERRRRQVAALALAIENIQAENRRRNEVGHGKIHLP